MNILSIIGGTLIMAGAAVMTASIIKYRAVLRLLNEFSVDKYDKIKRFFDLHRSLMFFFILGYLAVFYCVTSEVDLFGDLFVGIIFFFGAVFVMLGVQLQSKMLSSVENSYSKAMTAHTSLQNERTKLVAAKEKLEREMSERKRIEEALKGSEKRFRNLAETTSDWIWEVDKNATYTYASPKIREILGYEPEEILGKTPFDLMPEEEARRVAGLFSAIISSQRPFERLENKNLHKNGNSVILETSGVPTFDDNGTFSGYRGIDRDITKRKEGEGKQKLAVKQWQNTFDAIKDMIIIVGEDRQVVQMNQAVRDTLPYLSFNQHCYEIFHGTTEIPEQCISCHVFQTGNSLSSEHYSTHLKKWFDLTAYPIKNAEGKTEQVVHVFRDITDHKQAMVEKEQLAAQLQRSEKMEAIGTLAGGVAHDLNNILSGITSYPELILMDLPRDSSLRKPILTVQQSGLKAAAIVNDLLTLARRGVVAADIINLNDVVQDYLGSAEFEKMKSYYPDIQIETDYQTNLLNIVGSHVHLSKTIMNMVSNAAEAITGKGRISISTNNAYVDQPRKGYNDIEEGDYVRLKITDSGIGIPQEHLDKIFEPFYSKKKMGRSGTGLGMAVVWGTVMDHKGSIDVQSTLGKGTTFTLYFPATRKETAAERTAVDIEKYRVNGKSILVIDDVPEQREIASNMLSKLGYSVNTVSSGEEAVGFLKNKAVDLLVLDMIMEPGPDGLETYKRILELHPGQKAIIASGFSDTDNVKAAQELGAGQYIKKPYTLENIGAAVWNELAK